MRVAILDSGAIVVDNWLFGAPSNIKEKLKELSLQPQVVFTTSLRSPGMGYLSGMLSFKETPLNMNGMKAIPIFKKHGTDYCIESPDGKLLFSERGDVSAEDTEGYHLAIIKNKHRAEKLGDHVITWPWPETEYLIREGVVTPIETSYKVWSKYDQIPENLKTMGVSLEQANQIARIAEASAEEGEENWAVAISQFKKNYIQKGDHWVKREKEEGKVSKDKANYREASGDQRCGNCAYYTDHACTKVEGRIEPNMVSDIYLRSKTAVSDKMKEASLIEKIVEAGGKEDEILGIYRSKEDDQSYYVDFGDWATEETIQAVKQILGAKVEYEMEAPPPDKESWLTLVGKEWVEGFGPVQRFGDIFISEMHTAYNNVCDQYFRLGYMNEEERIALASAVGSALKTLRTEAPSTVMNRPIGEGNPMMAVPQVFKELAPNVPDTIKEFWATVYKSAEGEERWASISSVAVQDRQKETFSTKAMDWAVNFAKLIQFKGPLRYRHIPGLDGGDCDFQKRVGDFLFESGTFRNNAMGQKLKELMNKGFGVSLGLLFAKEDIIDGVYQRALIFERSVTPVPAVPYTSIILKGKEFEMTILTDEQLAQVAQELNMDVSKVKAMYEGAMSAGGVVGLKEFEAALKEAKETPEEEETEETTEETTKLSKKEMKEILESLTVAEFKELEDLITQVKAKAPKDDSEEEEEDEDYEEVAVMKKKKEADPLLAAIKQQGAVLAQQGETLTALVQMMATQQGNSDVERAVQKVLGQAPRNQTNFATKSAGTPAEQLPIDATVAAKLKELEDKIAANSIPDIRDAFTSTQLNR